MEVLVPKENNNDEFVLISKIHVAENTFVAKGQELIEFETSKISYVLEAPVDGYVRFHFKEGDEVEVNKPVCEINLEENLGKDLIAENDFSKDKNPKSNENEIRKFSDLALSALQPGSENNIEGRYWITERIVKGKRLSSKEKIVTPKSKNEKEDIISLAEGDELIKTSFRKRAEYDALAVSGGGLFQSTIGIQINTGLRSNSNGYYVPGIQDLVTYEVSKLLSSKYRDLNTFYINRNEIGMYKNVHAGISFDNDSKLTVMRISDSNLKSLLDIQNELNEMLIRFDDNKLSASDIEPATFTISDLSSMNVNYMKPLINGNQCLIIGIVKNSNNCYQVYLTFDHRVSEGLRISKFLNDLKLRIESYFEKDEISLACSLCLKTFEEEIKLGSRGFVKVATPLKDLLLCRNCYEGW